MMPGKQLANEVRMVRVGKKKDNKKTKAFYDWATTGIPVIRPGPASRNIECVTA